MFFVLSLPTLIFLTGISVLTLNVSYWNILTGISINILTYGLIILYWHILTNSIFLTRISSLAEYCYRHIHINSIFLTNLSLLTDIFLPENPYGLNFSYWHVLIDCKFLTGISLLAEYCLLGYSSSDTEAFPPKASY
jgi:hypothetical protein